jgi:hypothetical protein
MGDDAIESPDVLCANGGLERRVEEVRDIARTGKDGGEQKWVLV